MSMDNALRLLHETMLCLHSFGKDNLELDDLSFAQISMLSEIFRMQGAGSMAVSEIIHSTGLSKAAVSEMLSGLERAGYIAIERNSDDRRRKDIIVRAKAEKSKSEIKEKMRALENAARPGLSDEDIAILERILKRILIYMQGCPCKESEECCD